MKKLSYILLVAALTVVCTSVYASGGRGKGHWKHHRHHNYGQGYYPEDRYYGPPPPPVYQDRRTHQGLAGGVVGSVLGYELGNGHPLATGVGAAAGSFLGNELSGRR